MTRRLVVITGASAGLGEAFARAYAKRGWDVALTARRKDRLEALAADIQDETQSDALVLPQDLSEPGAVDTLLAALKERGRTVDGLVNNAGYGLTGSFFESDWSEEAAFLTVLFHAPIELVHKLLPGMAERNYGRIINV
ncbi:MAG: SDR family NAD(P)-dependent oxidoreductase, partial [Pseudomonadota bacterium]